MIKNLMNKKRNSKRKAFTLIELIIVIAIIAILAAVAVPKFLEIREKSNIKTDISNAKIIHQTVTQLITDDKITATAQTCTLKPSATPIPNPPVKLEDIILSNLDANDLKTKGRTDKGSDFFVTIAANGDVKIQVKDSTGAQVYPDNNVSTNLYSSSYKGKYLN